MPIVKLLRPVSAVPLCLGVERPNIHGEGTPQSPGSSPSRGPPGQTAHGGAKHHGSGAFLPKVARRILREGWRPAAPPTMPLTLSRVRGQWPADRTHVPRSVRSPLDCVPLVSPHDPPRRHVISWPLQRTRHTGALWDTVVAAPPVSRADRCQQHGRDGRCQRVPGAQKSDHPETADRRPPAPQPRAPGVGGPRASPNRRGLPPPPPPSPRVRPAINRCVLTQDGAVVAFVTCERWPCRPRRWDGRATHTGAGCGCGVHGAVGAFPTRTETRRKSSKHRRH